MDAALQTELSKLTASQGEMLAACVDLDCAWVTSRDSPHHQLLRSWVERGWAEETLPPNGADFLVAFNIVGALRALFG